MPARCAPTRLRLESLEDRLALSSGTLDTTFSDDGLVLVRPSGYTAARATDLQVQPDGKIVAAGLVDGASGTHGLVARFNPDGTPDTDFGASGFAVLQVPGNRGQFHRLLLQPDGKIVAVGHYRFQSTSWNDYVLVARFNTDGTPDSSFDGDGVFLGDVLPLVDTHGYGTALQPDGKIVVVGDNRHITGSVASRFFFLRLTANGSPDSTFDADGVATVASGLASLCANTVLVRPDGRLLALGTTGSSSSWGAGLVQLTADGSPDASFGSGGLILTRFPGAGNDVIVDAALMPDGKVVAAGQGLIVGTHWATQLVVARYDPNGTPDPTFGQNGYTVTPMPAGTLSGEGYAMQMAADGRIFVAGSVLVTGGSRSILAAYRPDGLLDTTFTPASGLLFPGVVVTDTAANDNDRWLALVVQPDGAFLAGGVAGGGTIQNLSLARFTVPAPLMPLLVDDSYSTDEDTPLTLSGPGLMANDRLVQPTTQAVLVTGPAHGTVTVLDSGGFTYTPALAYVGPDSFTYRLVTDGTESATATVVLTVQPGNALPVAVSDVYDLPASVRTFTVGAAAGVLINDTDHDGQGLTAELDTAPSSGTLTLNTDGSFSYTFAPLHTGPVTFTYRAHDGVGAGDRTTVTLRRTAGVAVEGDTLRVVGTAGPDVVRLTPFGIRGLLVELFTVEGRVRQIALPPGNVPRFRAIEVGLGDGDDRLDTSPLLAIAMTVGGGAGNDTLRTGAAADTIHADAADGTGTGTNTVFAGAGNNTITAGSGNNHLTALGGADRITVGHGSNVIDAGAGANVVTAGDGNNTVVTGMHNDVITLGSGANYVLASAGFDVIRVGAGNNLIDAGAGNDQVVTGGGANWVQGGAGNDILRGGAGRDILHGGLGNDLLIGGSGQDLLEGDAGHDVLIDGTAALTNPTGDDWGQLLAAYNPLRPASYVAVATRLTVTLDLASSDELKGEAGIDWFWTAGLPDLLDALAYEKVTAVA